MILPNSLSGLQSQQVILTALAPSGEKLALVVYADDSWGITSGGEPVQACRFVSSNADGPDPELLHLFMSMAGLPVAACPCPRG